MALGRGQKTKVPERSEATPHNGSKPIKDIAVGSGQAHFCSLFGNPLAQGLRQRLMHAAARCLLHSVGGSADESERSMP